MQLAADVWLLIYNLLPISDLVSVSRANRLMHSLVGRSQRYALYTAPPIDKLLTLVQECARERQEDYFYAVLCRRYRIMLGTIAAGMVEVATEEQLERFFDYLCTFFSAHEEQQFYMYLARVALDCGRFQLVGRIPQLILDPSLRDAYVPLDEHADSLREQCFLKALTNVICQDFPLPAEDSVWQCARRLAPRCRFLCGLRHHHIINAALGIIPFDDIDAINDLSEVKFSLYAALRMRQEDVAHYILDHYHGRMFKTSIEYGPLIHECICHRYDTLLQIILRKVCTEDSIAKTIIVEAAAFNRHSALLEQYSDPEYDFEALDGAVRGNHLDMVMEYMRRAQPTADSLWRMVRTNMALENCHPNKTTLCALHRCIPATTEQLIYVLSAYVGRDLEVIHWLATTIGHDRLAKEFAGEHTDILIYCRLNFSSASSVLCYLLHYGLIGVPCKIKIPLIRALLDAPVQSQVFQ